MNYLALSGVITFICCLLNSIFVFFKAPKLRVNQTLSLCSFFIALWGVGLFWSFYLTNYNDVLFWGRFLNTVAIWIPAFFLHFVYSYVKKEQSIEIYATYFIALSYFLIAIFYPEHFVSNVSKREWFLYYPDPGIIYYFFPFYFFILVSRGVFYLIEKYRVACGETKNQILYLSIAMAIGLNGGGTSFFQVFKIPIYPFGGLGLLIMVLIFAYAITKHNLMDISLIIEKKLSTVITNFLIVLSFFLTFYLLLGTSKKLQFIALLIVTFFWAFYTDRVRIKIQTTAEKKFLKSTIPLNDILIQISKSLSETLDIQTINTIITKNLKDEIEVKEIQFLLPNNFFNSSEPFTAYQNLSKHSILKSVTAQSDLVKNLIESKQIIYINNSEKLSDELPELNVFELIVPLFYKGDLIGILTVGPKLNEDKFSKKDIEFFQALAINLSSVLQLSKPFEEIKENYKKSLEAAEVLAEQAAYATLCKGIAHEINNPLGMLKAGAERLLANPDNSNRRDRCLRMIIGNVNRLSNITQLMLTYGKSNNITLTANVQVKSIIEDLLELVQHQPNINKKITFISDIQLETTITADADKLYQVLLNITLNAIEAIEEKGSIHISLTDKTVTGLNGNEYDGIEICICDTGKGMDESTRTQIFETFFTTKHDNTGLGLATSKTIINEHNGTIQVKSEPENGTQFIIQLPSNN